MRRDRNKSLARVKSTSDRPDRAAESHGGILKRESFQVAKPDRFAIACG